MTKKEILDKLAFFNADTKHLRDEAVDGYRHALKRVADYIKGLPMDKDEASKCITDWVAFVTDPKSTIDDQPCTDEEILEAMRMGAEALLLK